MRVRSLDWKNPLEKKIATCSSILAWEIPWTEEPGGRKKQNIASVDKVVEKLKHLWTLGGNVKWYNHYEK